MNKEIDEITEIRRMICGVCGVQDDCTLDNVEPCVACKELAEALYNAGYRKTVWHKVADGDLPNDKRDIVLYFELGDQIRSTASGYYDICVSNFVVYDFGAVRNQDVIAWTELPRYEEQSNDN